MKPNAGRDEIPQDEIDRMLSLQDEILPSSGFTVSVMEAVLHEATAPPPIPFPWKRALPGLVIGAVALLLVLVAGVVAIVQTGQATPRQFSTPAPSAMLSLFHGGMESAVIWTLLSLVVAFVSVKLSTRAVSGGV
jgi:hypothetical protein